MVLFVLSYFLSSLLPPGPIMLQRISLISSIIGMSIQHSRVWLSLTPHTLTFTRSLCCPFCSVHSAFIPTSILSLARLHRVHPRSSDPLLIDAILHARSAPPIWFIKFSLPHITHASLVPFGRQCCSLSNESRSVAFKVVCSPLLSPHVCSFSGILIKLCIHLASWIISE